MPGIEPWSFGTAVAQSRLMSMSQDQDQPIICRVWSTDLWRGEGNPLQEYCPVETPWACLRQTVRGQGRAQESAECGQAQALTQERWRRRFPRAWHSPLLAGSALRGSAPLEWSLCIRGGGRCLPIGRAGPPRLRPLPGPDASTLGSGGRWKSRRSGSRGERHANSRGGG